MQYANLYFIFFCYKHSDLTEEFVNSLDINNMISCKLNPAKICLQYVVEEFTLLCYRHFDFIKIEDIIKSNQDTIIPSFSTSSNQLFLENFFPFDPYLLKRSSRHFKGIYKFWKKEEISDEGDDIPSNDKSNDKSNDNSNDLSTENHSRLLIEDIDEDMITSPSTNWFSPSPN